MARSGSAIKCTQYTTQRLVLALRAAFDSNYYHDQFQSLYIAPEFPFTRTQYPAIQVTTNITEVQASGVGHIEVFPDDDGSMRKWGRSIFRGSVDLTVAGLSTLDRDILIDSIVEIIRFARFRVSLMPFEYELYGDPSDTFVAGELRRYQLQLNHDTLSIGGKSGTQVPWASEDELMYVGQVSIPIFGGFYNAVVGSGEDYLQRIDITSLVSDERDDDGDEFWVGEAEYEDSATIRFISEIDASE